MRPLLILMNQRTRPVLLSLAFTVTSLVVGLVSYAALQAEETAQQLVLGSVPVSPITYTIKHAQAPTECAGSLDISVDTANNQAVVTVKGWMLFGAFGRSETATFEASLVFNALGQLSASFMRCTSVNGSIRLGTLGVNPITAQVFKGVDNSPPLFEQVITGPIELKPRNGRYEIIAPQLLRVSSALPNFELPISLEVTPNQSCTQADAQAIDLTPILQTLAAFSQKVRGALPPL